MVALLAGAVLYLWLQLRYYQRVDYGFLIKQDERERQTLARLAALEQLVSDLSDYDRLHRADLAEMLSSSQTQLELQAATLHDMLRDAGGGASESPRESRRSRRTATTAGRPSAGPPRGELLFLRNEKQWDIAARLRDGDGPREIARALGISLHEVELVRSVIGSQRRSA